MRKSVGFFYVALTRTKNRVYIVVPQQHPSDFVRELVKDYPGVTVNGELDDCRETRTEMKRCPVCGYPMQLRYKKAYGLKLWICSNEPEICDFMTNNLKGGDLPILKCDCCKDGYLIVKEGWGRTVFGMYELQGRPERVQPCDFTGQVFEVCKAVF